MSEVAEMAYPSCKVTDEVRNFYDDHPYPEPIKSLDQYRALWQDPLRRRAEFHLLWPNRPYREDHSILVAGCGTSQAAKHALRFPCARVTGIDLSATSVQCTEELKRKYNLNNLRVYQLSIENVSQLQMEFDHIICTGVLHHLASPEEGLAALRDALKWDGTMHLMVYALYGRTGVYMLQDFCKRLNIPPTEQGIRDLIGALQALPMNHPLSNLLKEAPDFRHEAALADALLHPQDRAYSVPELLDWIEGAQLTFSRWLRQAPYIANCGLLAKLPQASQITHLVPKEQYAIAELFRGTMVRHNAIVCRNDRLSSDQLIDFTGNTWRRYVPLRMPDTIIVQERLPSGAAAVLINRNHTFRDIFLAIDSRELRLLESVDGQRTIDDIIHATPIPADCAPSEIARAFFEKLWHYDQAVFDASGS